jgi:hypothetical protein
LDNTRPSASWKDFGPDLEPESARYAADLFTVAAALRARAQQEAAHGKD